VAPAGVPQSRASARRGAWVGLATALGVAAVAVGLLVRPSPPQPDPPAAASSGSAPTPVASVAPAVAPRPVPGWVDTATCVGCHADAAAQWRGSNHAKAMAAPAEDTVRGDFSGTSFSHAGVTTRFLRRAGRFAVRTDGPDGRPAEFEVAYAFGIEPLQQYLLATPGGRLQPLQVAWDAPQRRWFHLLPHERAPAGDVLHWTGRYQTANTMCISCHVTGFEKRYDAASDSFASRWVEPNVSCQSCHGPGERHVAWARAKAEGRPAAERPGERAGLYVDFRGLPAARQVDVCSACHSRRTELTATAVAGLPRLDQHLPALLREGLYHADGQQLDEVFVDGSFRQSRMHQAGVACSDCHVPHTLKLRAQGNATCTQCHAPQPDPRFPQAAGAYDTPAHHHHATGSAGAQCVSCHMPSKNYMVIQPRRDHSMRVPRPDVSAKLGTPDACTACHVDRTPQWAAERVAQWRGSAPARGPHWGEAFAAARAGRPGSAEALAAVAADAALPAIVRATALDALRGEPRTGDAVRVAATRDADPEVRAAAADSLEATAEAVRVGALVPLLSDPVRAVRIAAARALSSLPPGRLDAAAWPAYEQALAEYVAVQTLSLDMPGPRLNLAVLAENGRQPLEAETQYRAALRIDPDFTPARANLARLYAGLGRIDDAERVLLEGLSRVPDVGELQYSLGLLLAERGRLPEAGKALARAAELMPQRARVHHNLGLALQGLGRRDEARSALMRAHELAPGDPSTTYAIAVLHAQAGRRDEAAEWARRTLAIDPRDANARGLLSRLPASPP
jgi:tetratricopeptide (TPR) repeat protein